MRLSQTDEHVIAFTSFLDLHFVYSTQAIHLRTMTNLLLPSLVFQPTTSITSARYSRLPSSVFKKVTKTAQQIPSPRIQTSTPSKVLGDIARPSTLGGYCSCNKEHIDEKNCIAYPKRMCGYVVVCCQACAEENMLEDSTPEDRSTGTSIAPKGTFYVYKTTPKAQWTLDELNEQLLPSTVASTDSAQNL
jgi:hypothetical protein